MAGQSYYDGKADRHMASRIIEGRDLSRMLGVSERELQQLAVREQLPFSFSPSVGIWIRRRDLPQWQRAVRR